MQRPNRGKSELQEFPDKRLLGLGGRGGCFAATIAANRQGAMFFPENQAKLDPTVFADSIKQSCMHSLFPAQLGVFPVPLRREETGAATRGFDNRPRKH